MSYYIVETSYLTQDDRTVVVQSRPIETRIAAERIALDFTRAGRPVKVIERKCSDRATRQIRKFRAQSLLGGL